MTSSLGDRKRKRQVRYYDDDNDSDVIEVRRRKCEKVGCPTTVPACFANTSQRCVGSGYTSRWYHISDGEHFCNECFDNFYRSHKPGHIKFASWKCVWVEQAKSDANLRMFMVMEILPYWVQCKVDGCHKWREVPHNTDMNTQFTGTFTCQLVGNCKRGCQAPEDIRVSAVLSGGGDGWIQSLVNAPLFELSPAAYLLHGYYPEGVGLSPTCPIVVGRHTPNNQQEMCIQPFNNPDEPSLANSFPPDHMTPDELKHFPDYTGAPIMFLAMRNLVLALWASDCTAYLTSSKCMKHLVVRGLVRIYCAKQIIKILDFLTRIGAINYGLVQRPTNQKSPLCHMASDMTVLIVGAGLTGVSVYTHLSNYLHSRTSHTCTISSITVLDAETHSHTHTRDRYIHHHGFINNPIAVLAKQASVSVSKVPSCYPVFDKDGKLYAPESCRRVNFHFNAILDAIVDWRKGKTIHDDLPLNKQLTAMHDVFLEETGMSFNEEQEDLFNYNKSCLETLCGCSLDEASTMNWDESCGFVQFGSSDFVILGGLSVITDKLRKGLDISYNSEVVRVNYESDPVTIATRSGEIYKANKVLLTVPPQCLQRIEFTPPLPPDKQRALTDLVGSQCEQVILTFPTQFWSGPVDGSAVFGYVQHHPEVTKCNTFYDLTPSGVEYGVLYTCVSDRCVDSDNIRTDSDIVDELVKILGAIFPQQTLPAPVHSSVSRWGDNEFSGRCLFSRMKIHSQPETYDILARSVNNKLYFAGPATHRQFPQSAAGAFLSGFREVSKILN